MNVYLLHIIYIIYTLLFHDNNEQCLIDNRQMEWDRTISYDLKLKGYAPTTFSTYQ